MLSSVDVNDEVPALGLLDFCLDVSVLVNFCDHIVISAGRGHNLYGLWSGHMYRVLVVSSEDGFWILVSMSSRKIAEKSGKFSIRRFLAFVDSIRLT